MAFGTHPSPSFLLHVSSFDGARTLVVPSKFELSSAPASTVWVAQEVLTKPIAIEIRGIDQPILFIAGRDRGARCIPTDGVELAIERLPLDAHPDPASAFGRIAGTSLPMRRMFRQIDDARRSDLPLLVRGETGTGKELVARSVHDGSARNERPYVVIDCAALTETLLESELFGHVRGAFSGATSTRMGAFEAANGGTVFIDEVGELPPAMQPKLLRVLESGSFRRVGENHHRTANVRVIAATHRDLGQMVAAGTFREDLYYRLAVLDVWVPPLRERFGDLPELVRRFVPSRVLASLTKAQWQAMELHRWRGNVRELRNFTQRAALLGWGELFDRAEVRTTTPNLDRSNGLGPQPKLASPKSMPSQTSLAERAAAITLSMTAFGEGETLPDFRARWADAGEAIYLEAVLRAERGNVSRAASRANVDRTHFHRLLRRHDLAKAAERARLIDGEDQEGLPIAPEPRKAREKPKASKKRS